VLDQVENNERDLVLPAIRGTEAILAAAKKETSVRRLVFISSFAAVITVSRLREHGMTWTSADWNPITYAEGVEGPTINGYRASKTLAEHAAWDCITHEHPHFDLVTLCPPLVFGPVAHPVHRVTDLNESSLRIWRLADGLPHPFPTIVSPLWVDVRDLAVLVAGAVLRPEVGSMRFVLAAPESFSFQLEADILRETFAWAQDAVAKGDPGEPAPEWPKADGETAQRMLGLERYRTIRETIVDAIAQYKEIQSHESQV
jgi:nucleoside-diphosphate-sugar epimerase